MAKTPKLSHSVGGGFSGCDNEFRLNCGPPKLACGLLHLNRRPGECGSEKTRAAVASTTRNPLSSHRYYPASARRASKPSGSEGNGNLANVFRTRISRNSAACGQGCARRTAPCYALPS
jgi:hypothetical protein